MLEDLTLSFKKPLSIDDVRKLIAAVAKETNSHYSLTFTLGANGSPSDGVFYESKWLAMGAGTLTGLHQDLFGSTGMMFERNFSDNSGEGDDTCMTGVCLQPVGTSFSDIDEKYIEQVYPVLKKQYNKIFPSETDG